MVTFAQGKLGEAADRIRDALAIGKKYYPSDHKYVLAVTKLLASLLNQLVGGHRLSSFVDISYFSTSGEDRRSASVIHRVKAMMRSSKQSSESGRPLIVTSPQRFDFGRDKQDVTMIEAGRNYMRTNIVDSLRFRILSLQFRDRYL